MSETMEKARRWIGYVCPDCRFVFRVPRDHDGQGIVCPSCRRLLKIPAADDPTPALVAAPKRITTADPAPEEGMTMKKRRRSRKGGSENHSWEAQPRGGRSGRGERRQMSMMLIGGGVLLALILGVVFYAMNRGGQEVVRSSAPAAEPAAAEPALVVRGESEILADAEPMAEKFLTATTVEEILPLVRHPEVTEARMRAFYPEGKVEPAGMAQFNTGGGISLRGNLASVGVRTDDFEERSLAFIDGPDGLEVDWESWVGWSELPWEEFREAKPTDPKLFRVTVSPIEYYNFAFTDDAKWQSYRLTSPDKEHAIYGYVEKGSVLEQRVRPPGDSKSATAILELKFPEDARSDNQVEIIRYVAEGWVEEGNQ